MGNFRIPGPVCGSRPQYSGINDGTLARTRSPVPALKPPTDPSQTGGLSPDDCAPVSLSDPLTLQVPPLTLSRFPSRGYSLLGGTLRAPFAGPSSAPSPPGPTKVDKRPTAIGKCAYLNLHSRRVQVPREQFDRLRKQHGAARLSKAETLSQAAWIGKDDSRRKQWPDKGMKSATAVQQDITIDGHTIRVIRPTDQQMRTKNLPTMHQLAEALRTVPSHQLELTSTIVLRLQAEPGSRGESGSGIVELFPVEAGSDAGKAQKDDIAAFNADRQAYFDALVTHECAHNYHGKFWHGPEDVANWKAYAAADPAPPSVYANESVQEDFAEFIVMHNPAVGTPCEDWLKRIYPNRWQLLKELESAAGAS